MIVELSRRISATRNRLEAAPRGSGRRVAVGLGEQLAEASLPAFAQRRHAKGAFEQCARLVREVQQRVDVRDRELFWSVGGLFDLVAGLDEALLEDAEVEPRAVVRDEQRRHRRLVHADADAVARDARLGDLEQRLADAVAVPDADLVVRQALDGEVLAELAVGEVVASELALPVAVGVDLVDEHRAMLAAVREPVSLVVAVDVDAADHPRAVDRLLPDRRPDGLALPFDLSRSADVDREQASGRHQFVACRRSRRLMVALLSGRRLEVAPSVR